MTDQIPTEVSHAEFIAEIKRIARGEPGWSSFRCPPRSQRKEHNICVDEEERRERDANIIARHKSGATARQLADDFDLHITLIYRIIKQASEEKAGEYARAS